MSDGNRLKELAIDIGWLLLFIAVVCIFISMIGCASSRPIEVPPPVETETVTTPLPCIYDIPLLEPLNLPDLPPYPGDDADEAQIKAWLVDLKTVIGEREALALARVQAYETKLEAHNRQGPKCVNIE